MEQAFNGDSHLVDEVKWLVNRLGVNLIIETGTYHGRTTSFLSTLAPVITTEINEEYLKEAKEYCSKQDNITFLTGNSPDILRDVLPEHKDKTILFFLDAHWNPDNVPLLPELEEIGKAGIQPIILIHDFKVPGKDFGYDSYNGQDYEWNWVEDSVNNIYKDRLTVYYNSEAEGARRGCLFAIPHQWQDLLTHENGNAFSQNGEDRVIEDIFRFIGTRNKVCVEFGGGDGYAQSNTRNLIENKGWLGLMLDGNPKHESVAEEWITAENINGIFDKYSVPPVIDLLSIDIDGNDLYVWDAIDREARCVVIEYNGAIPDNESRTIKYNPEHEFDKTDYHGASLLALKKTGEKKGMKLVYYNGLNAFFVQREYLPKDFDLKVSYKAVQGWPADKLGRPWAEI